MKRISRSKWRSTHTDYKSVIDGVPHILALDPETGATVLEPVEIVDDEEGES